MQRPGAAVVALGLMAVFCRWPLFAQQEPSFDVVSIKRNTSGDGRMQFAFQPAGRLAAENAPVMMLLLQAYDLPEARIVGAPSWARAERFDVIATSSSAPNLEQMRLMLRSLLARRFGLSAHTEMRDAQRYSLILARSDGRLGPGLRKTNDDCAAISADPAARARADTARVSNGQPPCRTSNANGRLVSGGMTMLALAVALSFEVGQPVDDQTGLAGDYEVTLEYVPQRTFGSIDAGDRAPLVTALPEQLGLKLEAHRGPADFLVIDRLERPTEN